MTDTVCSQCLASKPDIAYPVRNGRRNGRVCKACRNANVSRVAMTSERRVAAMHWRCPECRKGVPEVYPQSGTGRVSAGVVVLCRGCHNRTRRR